MNGNIYIISMVIYIYNIYGNIYIYNIYGLHGVPIYILYLYDQMWLVWQISLDMLRDADIIAQMS